MEMATPTPISSKHPEAEIETPKQIQPVKPLTFTNGVLKRHPSLNHQRGPNSPAASSSASAASVVAYKECLKNHAATLGGHALDGCGEFMPAPTASPADPSSLKCAACGCHRNFHRREPDEASPQPLAAHVVEYQPHHRHHPLPPPPPTQPAQAPRPHSPSSSHSPPPPISTSLYPSAPHMLLALSTGIPTVSPHEIGHGAMNFGARNFTSVTPRKRFRTKFSQLQKERMLEFAERVGWKMQRRDEDLLSEFCREIGVDRGVFKVWMHNNKNTFGKKEMNFGCRNGEFDNNGENNNGGSSGIHEIVSENMLCRDINEAAGHNGSSSSS